MERHTDDRSDAYSTFARYYDQEYGTYDADLDLYHEFAMQAGGPVLELGSGTGRVLAALQDTGLPLTGIDASASMLAIARKKLGATVRLVECEMEHIDQCPTLAGDQFWMAFAAINTFLHLPNAQSQLSVLEGLRTLVVPGGLFLLDLMVPEPHYLASLDGRLHHEATFSSGGDRVDKWVTRTHDLARQSIETLVFFDTTRRADGRVTRLVDRYITRYIHVFEIEHLLALGGWRMISLYGSYDLEPFTSDSERMIVLATWGDMSEDQEG